MFKNITPEMEAAINAELEVLGKWHDEHPNANEYYGTDKSYWLGEIKAKGFNPIGITVMTCEETIILATKKECKEAWKIFRPEGWWYSAKEWEKTRVDYINNMYDGDESKAPKVYCLNDKFKNIFK